MPRLLLRAAPAKPPISSETRPNICRSRPGSRPSGRRVRDEAASGGRAEPPADHYKPRAPDSEFHTYAPAHTGFERSETEHAPFTARLASERPPCPRRSSGGRVEPTVDHYKPRAPDSEFHIYAPSAPRPRVSSEARPSMHRSRPGSRPSGRRVGDEGASGGHSDANHKGAANTQRRRRWKNYTASPGLTRGFGARILRIWEARTKAYQPSR